MVIQQLQSGSSHTIITVLPQQLLTGHGKLYHEQCQKGKGNYNKFLNMVW